MGGVDAISALRVLFLFLNFEIVYFCLRNLLYTMECKEGSEAGVRRRGPFCETRGLPLVLPKDKVATDSSLFDQESSRNPSALSLRLPFYTGGA